MRILIVDDEPLELDQLEWIIHSLDPLWEIQRAEDGHAAIRYLEQDSFDLLLLDINMPGMDGLEVAAWTRNRLPDLPIIMVTARTDFASTQKALRLGVADYVGKPVIEKELTDALKKHGREREKPKSSLICNVQQLVQRRFAEKLSLVDIAGAVHVHPAYLSRRFHEEMGVPLTEYINRCRLDQAATFLLENHEWPISEVAEQTGFTSQHYFSTQFRKQMGVTPRQYRESRGMKK